MPRNSAGIYTLPNAPVVPDTIIESPDENQTRDDLAAEITNSLDRNGRGGMLAPFRVSDGTIGAPGLAFTNSTGSGLWRIGPDNWALVAGGVNVAEVSPAGFVIHVGVTGPSTPGNFTDIVASGNLTVGGTSSMTGAVNMTGPLTVGGRILANGGITLAPGQTLTGLTSLALSGTLSVTGATTLGTTSTGPLTASGVTTGSINSGGTLPINIGGTERARFTASGYFKASPIGTYFSPSLNYHEFIQSASDYILGFGNSGANPGGVVFAYSQAPNNSNQFNSFIQCIDNAATTLRADIMSNGGIRAYMANNVTLSDEDAKEHVRPLSPQDIAELWDAHRDIAWCAFRYSDQTHDDPNIGYVAQDIERKFANIAPWLVEEMETMHGRKRKFVYLTDLANISYTLVSECQRRIEQIEKHLPGKPNPHAGDAHAPQLQ